MIIDHTIELGFHHLSRHPKKIAKDIAFGHLGNLKTT